MALKDGAGLVKKYAMVNIQKYQNVAIGDTVSACQDAYVKLLNTSGITAGNESDFKTVTGTIQRIAHRRQFPFLPGIKRTFRDLRCPSSGLSAGRNIAGGRHGYRRIPGRNSGLYGIEPGVENFHLAAKEFHDIIRKIN